MKSDPSYILEFSTELFDYQGEIPEDYNAGNRFYGRDVAEFLSNQLRSDRLDTDFLDEDWGWLVLGKTDQGKFLEICVYNLALWDNLPPIGTNQWRLWIRMFEKRKWLYIFSRSHEIECEAWLIESINRVFASTATEVKRFEKGSSQ